MSAQTELKIEHNERKELKYSLEDEGVPSAHNPSNRFYPHYDGENWICHCDHFRRYKTPCRHIKDRQLMNIETILSYVFQKVRSDRDIRDMDCQTFDEVVEMVELYRGDDMNKLATIMLTLASYRGQVSTDDLHDATHEHYAGDKIMGSVCGALLKNKLIRVVDRKHTERKCAHGREIKVYSITKAGYESLHGSRPETSLEI